MAKKAVVIIPFTELRRGYERTYDNAMRFSDAATLLRKYPDKALALAQLGQEEVGRSLTLLAAFALPPENSGWQWFWENWTDHTIKGHRAYLYEIIFPPQLEMVLPDGSSYTGFPLRTRLSGEKESGFYVDFNRTSSAFEAPADFVSALEAGQRLWTLNSLLLGADVVRRTILHTDSDFRFKVFGELAFRICTENIYQQDFEAIVTEFKLRSKRHREAFDDLGVAIKDAADFMRALAAPNRE